MNKFFSKIFNIKHVLLISLTLSAAFLLVSCQDECRHLQLDEVTVSPTCSEEGYLLRTCAECSFEFRSDFVAPLGHDLSSEVVAPTCESEGYTEYLCECGYTFKTDVISPLGHKLTSTVKAPTCASEGYTEYSCECGYNFKSNKVAPLGHTFKREVKENSCAEAGHTVFSCENCIYSYTAEFVAPTGHDFKKETVIPTCDTTGYTKFSCDCGYSYIGDFLFYSDIFGGAYSGESTVLAKGLDVSKYNHVLKNDEYLPLDWTKIKAAGFDFVILKAGSTPRISNGKQMGGIEPTFEMDYRAAKEAGLDVGVYFYTYATTPEAAAADAELLIGWLEGKKLEYPVYFDIEDPLYDGMDRKLLTDLCVSFISKVQENKFYGALYTSNNWLMNYLQTDKVTFLFDIWYARYPGGSEFVWDTEKYGDNMGMWQYTAEGMIPEISATTKFDFNYAYKDYPAIIKELGYNGY